MLPSVDEVAPARALDRALAGIENRYGRRSAERVAVQIEYAWER